MEAIWIKIMEKILNGEELSHTLPVLMKYGCRKNDVCHVLPNEPKA